MTYEEIMSITPGSIVPGGCSVNPNATYMGPGEPILDSDGSALAGGHSVSTNDMIVVLDVGYTKQLALIQYPIGNGEYRQGYIVNNSNNIQYPNIGTNNWVNGSTTETVYLSYEGNQVLGSLDPHESAIFLYKVNDRYNIVYSTDKGLYTKAGFVNYSGGITAQALEGQVLSGGSGSSMDNLLAGSVVPGGRTYPVNATAQVDLDLRDAQGNSIPGREVSAGDELTVLDVGYTRQLALVQYPSGGEIRQGYITNNDKYIKYTNPNNWYNGSTPEPVLDASGAQIGTINPYESATKLYEANGLIEVVYNTDKGINTKSGFVKYAGTTPNIVHVDIPYPNVTSAELINYGTSGKGRALRAYKIGNGRNSFIYNCAIHGWEDNWPADGVELTKIGNQIIEHFQNNSTGDFTLYVIPAANPDGVSEGWTNNGPGRCTIVGGIDCNRDFPVEFTPGGRARNYTGSEPLNVPESKYLADFIQGVKSKTAGKTYLIDMHGWEQSAIGSSIIGEHFVGKLGLEPKYRYANAGYLIDWANSIGIISALIELPTSTHSHADVVNGNYAGKIIEGLTEIMGTSSSSTGNGTSSSSTGGNYNGKINSGVSSVNVRQEPNTNSTILGQLHGNDGIEILGKIKPSGDTYYWYRINYNGTEGYVRSDFATATVEIPVDNNSSAEEPFNKSGKVINVTTVLNVRKGPGVSYDIIGSLRENDNVTIVAIDMEDDGYWYKIKLNSGFGYIKSYFVLIEEDGQDDIYSKNVNDKYINIAKVFGFNLSKTMSYNYVSINNPKKNISFQGTAEVLNEQLLSFNSIRIYNGRIINAPKGFKTLKIPYGSVNISRIAEMLGNGLINFKIENNRLTIIMTAIENGIKLSSSLKISLQNIGIINGWTPLLSGINSKKSSITSIGEDILLGLAVVGLAAGLIAFAPGAIAVASEIGAEEVVAGTALKSIENFVEDNSIELTAEEIIEKAQVMASEMQEDLQKVRDEIKDTIYPNIKMKNVPIKKLCEARDLTVPDNIFRRAFGGSGTHIPNVTIGNEIASELYEQLSDKEIIAELVKQSEYSLTNEWFKEFYAKNREFFEEEGVNEDEICNELGKLRDMIQATKNKALEGDNPINNHGEPSLENDWNVENCAEIWAVRNAIIFGAKIENLVLKTVTFDKLKYAPPCANCQITFKSFIDSGRLLE